jgi:hypothetical protein
LSELIPVLGSHYSANADGSQREKVLVQTAYAAGGSDAVKQVLGPIMLDGCVIYRWIPAVPLEEIPDFHADPIPAPEVLAAGSWTE